MSKAQIGRVLIGIGVLMVLVGATGLLTGGTDDEPVAQPPADTTEAPPTTTPATAPPTATTATLASTTTSTSTSTTTSSKTTTTTFLAESVEDFVLALREALDADDLEFVFSRLHPAVTEAYGEDLCRAWTEREILALDNYQMTGAYTELGESTVSLPGGGVPIAELFEVPISFSIQTSSFEDNASYAREGGLVYWLGNCR